MSNGFSLSHNDDRFSACSQSENGGIFGESSGLLYQREKCSTRCSNACRRYQRPLRSRLAGRRSHNVHTKVTSRRGILFPALSNQLAVYEQRRNQGETGRVHGVCNSEAFVLRWHQDQQSHCLLVNRRRVNLTNTGNATTVVWSRSSLTCVYQHSCANASFEYLNIVVPTHTTGTIVEKCLRFCDSITAWLVSSAAVLC